MGGAFKMMTEILRLWQAAARTVVRLRIRTTTLWPTTEAGDPVIGVREDFVVDSEGVVVSEADIGEDPNYIVYDFDSNKESKVLAER